MEERSNIKSYAVLLPVLGNILFASLYLVAVALYPGGNNADEHAPGFSWLHNYWCNLQGTYAINGAVNTARPVALTAMFVLCVSLALFWFHFAHVAGLTGRRKKLMRFSGVACVSAALFIFTSYHDMLINMTGVLGCIAIVETFLGLRRMKWDKLFVFGVVNLVLIALNNIFYRVKPLLFLLAVTQKITFASCLIWVSLICLQMYRAQMQSRTES